MKMIADAADSATPLLDVPIEEFVWTLASFEDGTRVLDPSRLHVHNRDDHTGTWWLVAERSDGGVRHKTPPFVIAPGAIQKIEPPFEVTLPPNMQLRIQATVLLNLVLFGPVGEDDLAPLLSSTPVGERQG